MGHSPHRVNWKGPLLKGKKMMETGSEMSQDLTSLEKGEELERQIELNNPTKESMKKENKRRSCALFEGVGSGLPGREREEHWGC